MDEEFVSDNPGRSPLTRTGRTRTIGQLEAQASEILAGWALDRGINDPELPLSARMERLELLIRGIRKRAEELGW